MFTGLVEAQGKVQDIKRHQAGSTLVLSSPFSQLETGESIAVNGVCLTLISGADDLLNFNLSPETLSITNLNQLKIGDFVHLERALNATARLGGHYVSGHVDKTAALFERRTVDEYLELTIGPFTKDEEKYLVPKGSISVEGVSLTINAVEARFVKVMLVPHTLAKTSLGHKALHALLNIEFDYLAKLVAHQISLIGKANLNSTEIEV